MKLGWVRPELHELCRSRDGLQRLWPQDATDAQKLLTTIVMADTLLTLTRFRCLKITIEEPKTAGEALGITARFVEVTLKGTLVNALGSPAMRRVSTSAEWMHSVEAMLVCNLSARGKYALKAGA